MEPPMTETDSRDNSSAARPEPSSSGLIGHSLPPPHKQIVKKKNNNVLFYLPLEGLDVSEFSSPIAIAPSERTEVIAHLPSRVCLKRLSRTVNAAVLISKALLRLQ